MLTISLRDRTSNLCRRLFLYLQVMKNGGYIHLCSILHQKIIKYIFDVCILFNSQY